ncbi:PepSY domain-containing protein [Stenotrophomonas sp. SRS1]|uniref:PepSY-associated TM helix domain-containing protein n=1 Tax=Stenotrophomonas sp. SRS1 TaxID=2870345 RepID=UPI00223792A2|nr:PepSY-associated TM helix domain-containing protein [Stenotrophomonas sp. SRS1]MCW6026779.1 PepSY domain-containing protein [Stenotrophomonas sp. SRS1]
MNATRQPSPAPLPALPATGGGRRRWFELHSWIGLKLCLFMGFVCLTGTLAVFSQEIDWLLHKPMRVADGGDTASWGRIISAAQRARPAWELEGISAGHTRLFAARAQMRLPDGRRRFVWINPYTAQVTGDTGWFNVQRLLRNTHRHLMLPVIYGVPLVTALSVPLLLSWLGSLYIYKKWWRGFFKRPDTARPRRLWGDLHRLAGVWSMWFLLLIGITGAWYLVESLGGDAPAAPVTRLADGDAPPRPVDPAAVDAAVRHVSEQWPAFTPTGALVSRDGRGLVLMGEATAWLVRERANNIALDLQDGTVLGRHDGGDLGVHQRIAEMADPLHFGSFGGWPIRLLWFVAGALLTSLCFTGVYIYGLRTADALRARARKAAV